MLTSPRLPLRTAGLLLTVFLWTLGSALAQHAPAAPTDIFAAFEGDSWGDWMVEGEAFGSSPATDSLFPGKIRGFTGQGFACSLHPRRGNAALGRLISREFTIEKPFLAFRIGGGNHPKRACLNLVVEGEVTRTATGRGTPDLSDVFWDVSPLIGRRARLEIVDVTASAERGYVLVDDIRLADGAPGAELWETGNSALPFIEVPLRIVHVLDGQGKAEFFGGDRTIMTHGIARKQVAAVNQLFRHAGIIFSIAAEDFEIRRDDYLNLDFDSPVPAGLNLGDRAVKPPMAGLKEHMAAFRKLGREKPNRLTILVHRGSEWRWDEGAQQWRFGVGFSHGGVGIHPDGTEIVRICGTAPRV